LITDFLFAEGTDFASKLASILPTRRWTMGSAEYSGSPFAGDFIRARNSSRSESLSIVMRFSFPQDNNLRRN
jgi:hypothetical protein